MLELIQTKKTDPRLLALMPIHYSQPREFVGRCIPYAVLYDGTYYGHIVAGSATRHLPNRALFFGIVPLNSIVNNVFYHIERQNGSYPIRNFASKVIERFENDIVQDWELKYGDSVVGIETLVAPPRTGECYLRAGFTMIGVTKGFTVERKYAGKNAKTKDRYQGDRVWNKTDLRPKLVFAKKVS